MKTSVCALWLVFLFAMPVKSGEKNDKNLLATNDKQKGAEKKPHPKASFSCALCLCVLSWLVALLQPFLISRLSGTRPLANERATTLDVSSCKCEVVVTMPAFVLVLEHVCPSINSLSRQMHAFGAIHVIREAWMNIT